LMKTIANMSIKTESKHDITRFQLA